MNGKILQLQPRLRLLAELVPPDATLADVGTDHGYLPVRLLQERKIRRAIASDINPLPLEHARSTAAEYGVKEGIEFRLCPGLRDIAPEEVNVIVIAGMGGETIAAILEEAPWTREQGLQLLLQPMTKAEILRHWLANNGYTFTAERLVSDKGHLYPVLCVTGGQRAKLTDAEAIGGVRLEGDPLWDAYLERQTQKLRRKIEGLRRAGRGQEDTATLEELCRELDARKEQIACTL